MTEPAIAKLQRFGMSLLLGAFVTVSACSFKELKEKPADDLNVKPTFASLQEIVFTPKCASCHSGSGAPHSVSTSSYNDIMHNGMFPPLIIPGNPEQSSLYQAVASGRMPKDRTPLSKRSLHALYTWIKNGAKLIEDEPGVSPTPSPSPNPQCLPGEPGFDELGQVPKHINQLITQNLSEKIL